MLTYIHKFNSIKNKYEEMLSSISTSQHVISTTDWPLFNRLSNDRFEILSTNDLLPKTQFYEINRSYQLRNIFVPILTFGFEDEFKRVIRLFSEIGLAKKFKMNPGYFNDLVLSLDFMRDPAKRIEPYHVQKWEDPLTFISHNSACVLCSIAKNASVYILRKDSAEYILRRKKAENSLFALQNYTCQYCGRIAEHIDHIMPLSKGGSCKHDNLALSCKRCNIKKHDNTPDEAKMTLFKDFPEIDEKWAISSEEYFKLSGIRSAVVYINPNVKKKCYEIILLDKITGKIISEHFTETKTEAFWKFIELYESLNPNYTFNPFSRVVSSMRDVRDLSLRPEEEELKANIDPLKTKLKKYLKKPSKSFLALDVYSALIQEIVSCEKFNLNVFCCSICQQSGVLLADVSFYFYSKSLQEHFDLLNTVICESCSKRFIERQKVKIGKYWADIVIGNKWHTLESFIKKRIGILRGSLGSFNYELVKSDPDPATLNRLAEYVYLLDFCWSQGYKVSPWRPKNKINIFDFVT